MSSFWEETFHLWCLNLFKEIVCLEQDILINLFYSFIEVSAIEERLSVSCVFATPPEIANDSYREKRFKICFAWTLVENSMEKTNFFLIVLDSPASFFAASKLFKDT